MSSSSHHRKYFPRCYAIPFAEGLFYQKKNSVHFQVSGFDQPETKINRSRAKFSYLLREAWPICGMPCHVK